MDYGYCMSQVYVNIPTISLQSQSSTDAAYTEITNSLVWFFFFPLNAQYITNNRKCVSIAEW